MTGDFGTMCIVSVAMKELTQLRHSKFVIVQRIPRLRLAPAMKRLHLVPICGRRRRGLSKVANHKPAKTLASEPCHVVSPSSPCAIWPLQQLCYLCADEPMQNVLCSHPMQLGCPTPTGYSTVAGTKPASARIMSQGTTVLCNNDETNCQPAEVAPR